MASTRTKLTKTGFCLNGCHEGTKPVSPSGKSMPTCTFWEWCKCDCHAKITSMYEMIGQSREPAQQNPNYRPARRDFWMPGDVDTMPEEPLFSSDGSITHPDPERPLAVTQDSVATPPTAPIRSPGEPVFLQTPTGRKARGQLEYEVFAVCVDWDKDIFDWEACTPKNVSEEIGKRQTAECPSTGAIVEVWKRWDKFDFASWEKYPIRFTGFLDEPSLVTLEKRRMGIKRAKKRGEAELKRGIRPRQP